MRINNWFSIFVHLIIWFTVGFLLNQVFKVELRTYHLINGRQTENIEIRRFLPVIVVSLLFKAVIFYINALPQLSALLQSGKRGRYAICIGLLATALFGLELFTIIVSGHLLHFSIPSYHLFIPLDVLLYIIILGLSLTYFLTIERDKSEDLSRMIAEEQLKTELNFLKAQINPHFFLNTLNNLYSMAQARDIDELESGILQLSEMMRYILYECQADAVAVGREIEYIRSYIGLTLMRYRRDGNIEVNFEAGNGTFTNLQIAPVILIPFVENAFKYGISLDQKSIIDIRIGSDKDNLFFDVKNTDYSGPNFRFDNKGIGISNVKRRLEMLYHDKYVLDINNDGGYYSVSLKLTINEVRYN